MVYALYTGDKQSTQNVSDPPAVAVVVAVGLVASLAVIR